MPAATVHRALVAREGTVPMLVLCGLAFPVCYFGGLSGALPLGVLCLCVLYLFREPHHMFPSDPLAILSPVVGVVTAVQLQQDTRLDRLAQCVHIKSGLFDAGVLRSPAEGKVLEQWMGGSPVPRCDFWIQTDETDDVLLSLCVPQHRRFWTHTILCAGERVGHGQRCGFFCFGVQATVWVSKDDVILVKPGTRVAAGGTILARLAR